MGLFRYPGGKQRLSKLIVDKLSPYITDTYCEPFVGAGGTTFLVLSRFSNKISTVYLNDIDYGIYAVWLCVYNNPQALIDSLFEIKPSVEFFYETKNQLLNNVYSHSMFSVAAMKIAVHQMSFSGLGEKAGGPIGGRKQNSKYDVGCRWNPHKLANKIYRYHDLLHKFDTTITNYHFAYTTIDKDITYYIDPPYYEIADSLYTHTMDHTNHCVLRDKCGGMRNFVLSYNNHPKILNLYKNFHIDFIDAKYTIGISKESRQHCKELLITPC